MIDGSVRVVIVCEDIQQACFIRRFLIENNIDKRKIRENIRPGFSFVLKEYPKELSIYRSKSHDASIRLIICIDADDKTIAERKKQLDDECLKNDIETRRKKENVLFIIPKRNIETWLAFLRGEIVNEESKYHKHECQAACQTEVKTLAKSCQENKFEKPAPPSLIQACDEYKSLM